MIVVCARESPRSAIISERSRKLSLYRRYQRTQSTMISWSKCRPLKSPSIFVCARQLCRSTDLPTTMLCPSSSHQNQATLMRHKTREMLVSQRTRLLNALRGHLSEVGVIAAQGPRHGRELAELIEACDETISFEVCEALAPLVVQLRNLDEAIARLDRTIAKLAQEDETARRLMSIPGFGPITASALAASVQDTSSFAGPREFAAFLGLTPKQNSSGGKQKLGRIS